jgi:solute carrier family 25, member 39/40
MPELFREVLREEGIRGFANGVVPRAAKVAPSCAIMITCYELCKSLIERYRAGGSV